MKLINIGYGNLLVRERIVSVVSPEAAPIKRMIIDAKESGRAIDASCGKKTRSVIITDSDHVILSAIQAETVANRLDSGDDSIGGEDEEED